MRSAVEKPPAHLPSGATQMCDFISGFSIEKVPAEESRVFRWSVRISSISGKLGPLPSRCNGCCRGFLFPAFSRVRRRRPLNAQPVSFVAYKSPHHVLTGNLDTAVYILKPENFPFVPGIVCQSLFPCIFSVVVMALTKFCGLAHRGGLLGK